LILEQNRLRCYAHVLRKEDIDWVKKCMEYEVEGSRPRGRPKRTRREVVQKDCQARSLNRVLMFLLVPGHPGSLGQRAVKRLTLLLLGARRRRWQHNKHLDGEEWSVLLIE